MTQQNKRIFQDSGIQQTAIPGAVVDIVVDAVTRFFGFLFEWKDYLQGSRKVTEYWSCAFLTDVAN